jgi:hypothetical protein
VEIPTAEPVSGPQTLGNAAGLPVAPVVDPIRLPVSRIARRADPVSMQVGGSSESVNSVLQNEEFDDEDDSRSQSHSSAQSSPGPQNRAQMPQGGGRAPVVTFGFTPDSKYESREFEKMSEQYVAVTKKEKMKRACYRCGKRKWESCLVCDARYVLQLLYAKDDGINGRRPQVRHLYRPTNR